MTTLDPKYLHLTIDDIDTEKLEHVQHLELNGKWFDAAPSTDTLRYERKLMHEDIMREQELETLVCDMLDCMLRHNVNAYETQAFGARASKLGVKRKNEVIRCPQL